MRSRSDFRMIVTGLSLMVAMGGLGATSALADQNASGGGSTPCLTSASAASARDADASPSAATARDGWLAEAPASPVTAGLEAVEQDEDAGLAGTDAIETVAEAEPVEVEEAEAVGEIEEADEALPVVESSDVTAVPVASDATAVSAPGDAADEGEKDERAGVVADGTETDAAAVTSAADAPATDAPAAKAAPRAAAAKPSDSSKADQAAEPSGSAKADQPVATPATKAGWDTSGGARRYLDASGTPLTGAQMVDGADYYFDPATGAMATSRLVTVGGRTYYYGADGRRASGEAYVDGAWRYFDPATGAMATSSYETLSDAAVPGGTKTVWYGDGGAMAFGEVLFGSESSGGRVGAWRFFDPKYNGDMVRDRLVGLTDPWGPKTVWYGDGGAMAFGEAYAQGAWRHFDEGNGAMARSQFLGLADAAVPGGAKTVWYDADGAMAFGEAHADGAWRFFDPKYNGDMARDRFVGLTDAWGPKTVWYGDDGAMAFGEAHADGAWRCFDEGNGALLSGDRVMARVLAAARACVGQSEDQAWSYLYDACASGADWCEYGPCIATVWHFFKAAGVPHFLTGDLVPGWPHEAFDWLSARGRISQTPRVGSVVFFNYGDHGWMQGLSAAHAEIVTGVDANGAVRSIGALAGGILTHVLDTWAIVGYGLPAYL